MPSAFVEESPPSEGLSLLRFVPADRRGLLDDDAFLSLGSFCREASARPGLRCVLLRGASPALFAAGADLGEIGRLTPESAGPFADRARLALAAWEGLAATTVCLVEGACYGGALDLVLASDLILAGGGARFAHPGAKRGIVTGWGGTARARRRLSETAMGHLFARGEAVGAEEARGNGLADFLVSGEAEALVLAAGWAGEGGEALRELKKVCRAVEGLPPGSAVVVEERTRELMRAESAPRGPTGP